MDIANKSALVTGGLRVWAWLRYAVSWKRVDLW